MTDLRLRPAGLDDVDIIRAVQVASFRGLAAGYYTPAEIESGARYICQPDRQMIADGTYVLAESGGAVIGCGGWSFRSRGFAGPDAGPDDDTVLDPATDAARIRAMFVLPDRAGRGVGRAILRHSEAAAAAAGFRRAFLGATLSGELFYRRHGYREIGREEARMPDGQTLTVVHMEKPLAAPSGDA